MTLPVLTAHEALLFVTGPAADGDERLLIDALDRLGVQAERRRVVALLDAPLLGARHRIRVAPCLLLDTGSRQVQLVGDPALLNAARLESALARH
jgi:hypothetical protein